MHAPRSYFHLPNAVPRARVPYTRRRASAVPGRSGISLMEVLIAIFVVSIGLMGIAALIPVANYALRETGKADRSAACGQAAMRDIRVRGLADPEICPLANTGPLASGATYVIDPLGPSGNLGAVTRVHYSNMSLDMKERVFYSHDDLVFDMQEGTSLRPVGFASSGGGPIAERSYSWFFTVTPSPADDHAAKQHGWPGRKRLNVSVAVCYQRDFDQQPPAEGVDKVLVTGTPSGTIISGVRLTGRPDPNKPDLETGQWILLSGLDERGTGVAQWYRITAGSGNFFALEGPNWPSTGTNLPEQVVVVPGVLGVYTTTVELNRSPQWWE